MDSFRKLRRPKPRDFGPTGHALLRLFGSLSSSVCCLHVEDSQDDCQILIFSFPKNRYETERFTQDDIIYKYLADKRLGLDRDIRKDIYQEVGKINFNDLEKFAKDNISGKPFTYCIVASEKRVNAEDLAKYGEIKKLSLEEIFGY